MEGNPFFSEFDTPFGTPPFDLIKENHFMPAIKEGIAKQQQEIASIVGNDAKPTFKNTVEALERSGSLLTRVLNIFGSLRSAHTNDDLQRIAKEAAPLISKHRDDISLNEELFVRVKAVYEQREILKLTEEQRTLLVKYYRDFVRGGANLDEQKKVKMREINEELSLLTLQFGENVLKENNVFELVITGEENLAGLPESVIASAAETAKERGREGQWIFTLHKPSMIPFLQYSERRGLREQIFRAYVNRGNNNNEEDNKEIAAKIASLRHERAKLLGYDTYAQFVLELNMAREPKRVYDLLNQLWEPALRRARNEIRELQDMIRREGDDFELQPWDWWYYAEKVKKAKYDLDDEALRPYFRLEDVRSGAFSVANKLFGIQFIVRKDLPKYHEDVETFEVKEADGRHLGVLYTDFFPRASKQGGAWMNSFRKQSRSKGMMITPVVSNVCNFSKPTGGKPALLSFEEVLTLFHEFGHALHGLLSNATYDRLSGTAVPSDFVELPSQIMENWASHPDAIKTYAKHYETGEPIPRQLIDKLNKANLFNQGFATVEYLASSFLDMDWHTITEDAVQNVLEFENKSFDKIGLIPEIVARYRSPYFNHIFSWDYAAGYYSYIWAEVLDADAFEAFKQKGVFDPETALSFRKHILETGGTADPMILYKRFRGAEPRVEPLLKKRGLN